jgi:hypothetical protein
LANRVSLDKGRAPLQSSTVERFGVRETGSEIPVWLLVVDPGHLRVFSKRHIADLIDLDEVGRVDTLWLETREERERLAALRMRLISTSIVVDRRQLKIPAEAFDICGEYLDRTHVWIEQSSLSHVDVYTATYVQRVLAIAPSQFLPGTFQRE